MRGEFYMKWVFSRKKIAVFLLVFASLFIFVTGCSSNQSKAKSGNSTSNKNQSNGNAKKKQYLIKIASPSSKKDSCVKAYYQFKKLVEKKSNGRIKVQVFPNGQLGDQKSYIQQMQSENLQIGEVTAPLLEPQVSGFGVFSLPYIASSMDQERKVIQNGLGDQLGKKLENKSHLKIIGWLVRAPRSVYSSTHPIKKPSDFKGMKIRVMQSPIMVKAFKLLGANPTAIPAKQRYTALQSHVVDAAENSPPLIVTQKEYEVTKYLSLTKHFITPNLMVMDQKYFNQLPKDLQKVVTESGKEAANYEFNVETKQLNSAIKTLKQKGMKVNKISDVSGFRKKVQPLYKEYQDKIGKSIINEFLNN